MNGGTCATAREPQKQTKLLVIVGGQPQIGVRVHISETEKEGGRGMGGRGGRGRESILVVVSFGVT